MSAALPRSCRLVMAIGGCAGLVLALTLAVPAGASPASTTTTTTVPSTTTTTTVPRTTTTTTPPASTTTTVPAKTKGRVPTLPTSGGPPAKGKGKGTPAPAVSAAEQQAAVQSVTTAVDRLQAITTYTQLRHRVAVDRGVVREAEQYRQATEQQASLDRTATRQATSNLGSTSAKLADLAIAAYTGAAYGNPDDGPDAVEASGGHAAAISDGQEVEEAMVMVAVVTSHEEQLVHDAHQDLARTRRTARAAGRRAASAERLVDSDEAVLATTEEDLVAAHATATDAVAASTEAATASGGGPTILGRSLVTASELAGWYASTGEHTAATVPMSQLAADYVAAGRKTGVRADVAFAQSVVETGYFSFPSGGQLTGGNNNFAGIGACDSCAHGRSFPDALTGVTAQLELLDAYATPHAVPTPLIGPVGIGGCCTTWMALSGHWATNPAYGIEILAVYTRIVDWAIPGRLVAAGLAPARSSART